MSRPFIVLGDSTTHGGTVVGASGETDTGQRRVARVGDSVACPIPGHGVNPIVTGDSTTIVDGQPVARHGDMTACGATLICSQSATTTS